MEKDKAEKKEPLLRERKEPEKNQQPMHELWGVIFISMGLLIVISLVSHFVNPHENILGPWLGRYLSRGLILLFGSLPAFFLPLAVMVAGYRLLRGSSLYYRTFVWSGVITIELCILLAIHNLPVIRNDASPLSTNIIGNFFVYYPLYMIFGPHRFGPYFLFSIALLLTVAVAADINIRQAIVMIGRILRLLCTWVGKKIARIWRSLFGRQADASPAVLPQTLAEQPQQPQTGTRRQRQKTPSAAAIPQFNPLDGQPATVTDVEEQAKKLLEQQLAEFRSKRNEPIKITLVEPKPIEEETQQEETQEERLAIEKAAMQDEEPRKKKSMDQHEEAVEAGETTDGQAAGTHGDEEGRGEGGETADGLPEDYYKAPEEQAAKVKPKKIFQPYQVPSVDILPDPPMISTQYDQSAIEVNSHTLEKTLLNFGIEGKVISVSPGPVVTRYEVELAPGIKLSRMVSLHDDLSLAVGGKKIRIEAPIPGKAAVGIELPNDDMQLVYFKHILLSEAFTKTKAKLPIVIGRSISGTPFVADITKMPHILIAGQTGSGKSVCINSIICSLLMTKTPEELRLIMVDPKKVELSYFEGIPHLMAPVVTESKEAVRALQWTVVEMTRRYRLLSRAPARNIDQFNKKVIEGGLREEVMLEANNKPLPFLVVIVDELADLMITSRGDVEALIQRIAQLARAVGIHLIVATQRPSTDIITGPIKANLTSRIAFRTISHIDSRTIIDTKGAEKLLGRGDMLFLRSGAPDIERYHGAYISEEDVETIVAAIRSQDVDVQKMERFEEELEGTDDGDGAMAEEGGQEGRDEKFAEAARLVVSVKQGSTSLLQRHLKLGFARAGRLMDQLEQAGIVGPSEGSKAREVLVGAEELEDILSRLGYS